MTHGKVDGQATAGVRKKRLGRAGLMNRAGIWLGRALICALALLVVVWIGKQVYLFCVERAIRTENAQWSVLATYYNGEAIIMRNETVITAPVAGSVSWLVPEGARVHIGTAIARISGAAGLDNGQGTSELQSPAAGTACYHLDGWEGMLTPAQYQKMDLFALFNSVKKSHPNDPPQAVRSGEPLYKIIDNLIDPYLAVKLDKQPKDLTVGDRVTLTWGALDQGSGRIIGLHSKSGVYIAVVEVSQISQDLGISRTLNVKLVNKKCEGIVLPAQALVTKGGERGVYTRTPLGFKFKKVQVIGAMGDQVALQGIQPDMEVVVNPDLLKRIDQEI